MGDPLRSRIYLDPKHPRYAPRLAAAVNAWLAVTQANGGSVKDAIRKWLREPARQHQSNNAMPRHSGAHLTTKVKSWRLRRFPSSFPAHAFPRLPVCEPTPLVRAWLHSPPSRYGLRR